MFLWIKAFHIIAVICWFAGFFYLPRLFVYHAMSDDQATREQFKTMERKLYRGIMTPAGVVAILLGIYMLVLAPTYLQAGWMHLKLSCVILLIIHHLMCGHYLKQFKNDCNTHSHTFYRWFNELPVLVLVTITILVVIKPF